MKRFALVVPTLNPGPRWSQWLTALEGQTARPSKVLVIDSKSDDGHIRPVDLAHFEWINIPRDRFNHGATRQYAFEQVREGVSIVVFMTQDALLADAKALERLLDAFDDPAIAAAYGRQLPHPDAGPFGAHSRLFNYGGDSMVKRLTDRDRMGIKACFLSNSFAAYRCSDLNAIGGFPVTTFGEDMLVAARLLLKQRWIAYVADARVFHSHDYSIREEFSRYFETGRIHARNPWLLREFGGAGSEGRRFLLSEIRYLLEHSPYLLPESFIRTLTKYLGYRLGKSDGSLR